MKPYPSLPRRVLASCLFAAAVPTLAATYRVPPDDVLIAKAGAIVRGQVVDQASAEAPGGGIHTDITIAVERVLKGRVLTSRIVVRQPGGSVGDRSEVYPGIGAFSPGEKVLLMLDPLESNLYRLTDFAIGKFTVLTAPEGTEILRRDGLRDAFVLDETLRSEAAFNPRDSGSDARAAADQGSDSGTTPGSAFVDPDRDAAAFEHYIVSVSLGLSPAPDYERTPDDSIRLAAFEFLGNPPARWSEFDNGIHVHYKDNSLGDGGSQCSGDGCHPEVAAGVVKWNVASGAQIFVDYDGTDATIGSKCLTALNNQISFEPRPTCNDMTPLSGCTGTLAVGGFSSSTALGGQPSCPAKNNPTFQKIVSAKIMVNDTTGNCLNSCDYTEMITHETGHTLGAGHTNVPNSLMNALLNSGTCGLLRADDLAFAQCAYPQLIMSCDLTASRTWVGPPPQSINFQAHVSGGTAPFSYDYDFGDGSGSTAGSPSHTYGSASTFTATVTITGADNQICSADIDVTVQPCLPSNVTTVTPRYSAPIWKAIVAGSGFKKGSIVQIDSGSGFVNAPVTKRKSSSKLVAKDVTAIWPAGVPVMVRVLSSTGCPSNPVQATR